MFNMKKNKSKKADITKRVPDTWSLTTKKTKMYRTFEFSNFVEGFLFVARITIHAEVQKHHPDVALSYGKVKVTLTTHEKKTITSKDIKLAKKIDQLYTT